MNLLLKLLAVSFLASAVSCETLANTTRYWDCCKASCSWAGQGPVSAPVQVCAKDGVTAVAGETASGCGGGGLPGKSYMCNNNQPHTVNSSVALGFAAAQLAGLTVAQSCCACYELAFKDTAIAGHKLIVQVTNSGVDLAKNHFDIQMPGGGVGIFGEGCHTQWGVSVDGWGARYGGIHADTECSQLPKELQAGCHWRFGWFKNADNPKAAFHRVQCPKSLIAKTKCHRSDESSVANAAYVNL